MELIGKYVVVRSSPSGCWAGVVEAIDGDTVDLTSARRLWRWWSAKGVSLSGVAEYGLDKDRKSECRIAVPVTVRVFQVCEIIEASEVGRTSIEAAEVSRG